MTIVKRDAAMGRIVSESTPLEVLVEGLASAEGPVWIQEEGCLLFSEVGIAPVDDGFKVVNNGRRYKWDPITRSSSLGVIGAGFGVCAICLGATRLGISSGESWRRRAQDSRHRSCSEKPISQARHYRPRGITDLGTASNVIG
jgi:sugar lactone lactonase YvrE